MGRLPNKIKQNPKLVLREMSDGRASLWLEYYLGRTETLLYDDDGEISPRHRFKEAEGDKQTWQDYV